MSYSLKPEPSIDDQRMAWRKALTEEQLRELAADYLMGRRDESTADAYEEYHLRFGDERSESSPASRKSKKRRTR